MSNLFEAGKLSCQCGRGVFDLSTYSLRVPQSDDLLEFNTIRVHENGHWVRWNSTTMGMTLTWLKYTGYFLVRGFLSGFSPRTKKEIAKKLLNGKAMFQESGPPDFTDTQVFDIPRMWQWWMDIQVAYSSFYDSGRFYDSGQPDTSKLEWSFAEAIAAALNTIQHVACDFSGVSQPNSGIRISDDTVGWVRLDGFHLTTGGLYETMASADELMMWDKKAKYLDQWQIERHVSRTFTSYGIGQRILQNALGDKHSSTGELALTAAFLADFALNPPIPPLIMLDDCEVKWEDIYPPLRFVRCVKVIQEVGLLEGGANSDDFRRISAALSNASGMRDPYEYGHGFLASKSADVEGFSIPTGPSALPHETEYISFLSWVQQRLWLLRETNCDLIHTYGLLGGIPNLLKSRLLTTSEGAGWYTGPFQTEHNGQFAYDRSMSPETVSWYTESLSLNLALNDIATRSGTPRTRFFGNDSRFPWEERLKEVVGGFLGQDFWK